jgi:leucine dehydrogenase
VSDKVTTTAKTVEPTIPTGGPHSTDVFEQLSAYRHEQVSYWYDPVSGYRGIIAIHNTALGPALGGTRFWQYESDAEALYDVLRLSRGMPYKASVAGLNLGGGKSVMIGDSSITDREQVFRSHGRHVESVGGRYITAEDVGTSTGDMEFVHMETKHVCGLADRSGDPSPVTALGTYKGIQACAKFRYGDESLSGKTVLVQGVGHVGYYLCKHLHDDGAKLVVSDTDDEKVKRAIAEFGATGVGVDEIYARPAEIFAPCALGAVVNDETLKVLKVDIIAGAANNQLEEERHGDILEERGVVYAPDYVINAGGLINVNAEVEGWDLEGSHKKAEEIGETIHKILLRAKELGIPSWQAADRIAEERVAAAEKAKGLPHRI